MAISQSLLRSSAYRYEALHEAAISAANARTTGFRTAFLCHSHKDVSLVKGLVVFFRDQGVSLYIDWQDETMPEKPNSETARRIQGRIIQADLFLFLATANSKSSRWCPWEIGYADSSRKHIYIIPTTDGSTSYGNEYLDLYPKIDTGTYTQTGKSGYFVFQPNAPHGFAVSDEQLK